MRLRLLIAALLFLAPLSRAETPAAAPVAAPLAAPAVPMPHAAVVPASGSGVVGQLVAKILEEAHYNHHPIDKLTSRQALRGYIDDLDYDHLVFEKSDVDGFEAAYADTLGDRLKDGDIAPAYEIFNAFASRLEKREAFVQTLFEKNFDFSTDDVVQLDRHKSPWPASAAEAEKLWRLKIKYELLQERLNKTKPEERDKTVHLRYERLLRSVLEYDSSDVLELYLTALAHTFDPHSDYLAASQKENFDISMRLSLVGIGAVLRSEDGYAKVVSLVPGGPADVGKRLKPNDRIEAVAQADGPFEEVVGMKLDKVVQLIRGAKATLVRLRVIPADAVNPTTRVVVSLIRDEIKLTNQEARAKIIEVPGLARTTKVGVIDLPSFYSDMKGSEDSKSTTRDLAKLIEYLAKQGIEGLVIDLRRNGGGSLAEAVSLTELFIKDGPVVQVKDSAGTIKVLSTTESEGRYSGPMVVLTSRMSASASEIFAGALQDYGRAVIVGEKKHVRERHRPVAAFAGRLSSARLPGG